MRKFIFLVVALLLLPLCMLTAQERGLSVVAKEALGTDATIGKQWAVFVAIDRYKEWDPLSNPVRDAKEIRDILNEQYFIDEVVELYDQDATAANIRRLLGDLRQKVKNNDSLFVFYAGHGQTDSNTNTGFWIPVDAGRDHMVQANWLPNIQIRNLLSQLPAKHVFLISDACFSGDILDISRGASPQINSDYYRRAYSRVSRQVMTSGASETVPDSSEFAQRLKSALRRAEGLCIDPLGIFNTVREVRATQPLLGTIAGSEHESGGSFLFFKRPMLASPPQRPVPVPDGFVKINGGTFTMGSPAKEANRSNDETQHQVTVSDFYVGKYEVTQAEYEAVMGKDKNPSFFQGSNFPVECVSWFDAINYCNERSKTEGLEPAYIINGENVSWNRDANGYRLPTEAEWEYACRAGTTTPFRTGNTITTNQANYDGQNLLYNTKTKGENRRKPTAVGNLTEKLWDLYDMHGNVYEWCWDWYGSYSTGNQINPTGAAKGDEGRVIRGGSWNDGGKSLRSSNREHIDPSESSNDVGFRLARSVVSH